MQVDLMRRLDRCLGAPLCFILTVINYLKIPLRFIKKDKTRPAKKILFIKLSEMGAIVLAYPLLRRVKREFSGAELFFLTFERNRGVFAVLDNIIPPERILTISDASAALFMAGTIRAIRRMRREGVDVVFDLEFFSRFTAILSYLSGAAKRIGFHRYDVEGLYRGSLLTHNIQYNPLLHISRSYFSLWQVVREGKKCGPDLEAAGGEGEFTLAQYVSMPPTAEKVKEKLKRLKIDQRHKLFLIGPGEGMLPLREWPLENFVALSGKILEREDNYVIIVGTQGAAKKAQVFCREVNDPGCINLTGQTSIPELLELFLLSHALIANDCGLAHLASLTPIKKFIIFGPESPQVFGPGGGNNHIIYAHLPCSPCLSAFNHRNSACKENKCLEAVKVEDLYNLIGRHL